MRENINTNEPAMTTEQSSIPGRIGTNPGSAFEYLRNLPENLDRAVLKCLPRDRDSRIIESNIAANFTGKFRSTAAPFEIPVSWTMTKTALINLLGITSYVDYSQVNGIRFYAGVNCDNQLTLIAVSTEAGVGCNEDLTEADNYPYYDFADPCPTNCSNNGNLKATDATAITVVVTQ